MEPSLKNKILIVEDDETIRQQMKWALAESYEVFLADNRRTALDLFRRELPAVVTLDLGLPPHPREATEGLLVLSEMLEIDQNTKVIVVSGNLERANALKAIEQGAYDFFYKPVQVDELKVIVQRAVHVYQLEHECQDLQKRLSHDPFEEMLGESLPMKELFTAIRKVSTTDVPVVILGESGTGKELVARAIHRKSGRKEGPIIAINCSAIPEQLLESELFGHEKGAFTGAHIQRKGRIESAQGGTLFLDEIGELPLGLQVKLLRFLQSHRVERVGGREEIEVDVRVIAATHVDLKRAMAEGRFREDLFYRLGVVVIAVPPLREREDDILLLAKSLLQRYSTENKKKILGFNKQAIMALQSYPWPGNVRELENRVRRAVIMAEGQRLTPEDLELSSPFSKYEGQPLREAREAIEREMIQKALAKNKGNITQTATQLGITRPTLYELMGKLGIGDKE
jgi:two-component system NtrC family response regulator